MIRSWLENGNAVFVKCDVGEAETGGGAGESGEGKFGGRVDMYV